MKSELQSLFLLYVNLAHIMVRAMLSFVAQHRSILPIPPKVTSLALGHSSARKATLKNIDESY